MKLKSHWHHAILTFALTVLAAGVFLPLVRVQPESVHKYFNGLNHWIRISFTFSVCVVFMGAMFKLLSPRIGHLAHLWSYPPSWLAALLGWIVVAFVDVQGWFDTDGYRANVWEWLGYGGGSILLVGWYSGLWSEILRCIRKPESVQAEATECITLQDIENAPWEEIEAWLKSDETARYDFLGSQSVAHRVSLRVSEGTRSVGIVGPYGSGKTSIVTWITDRLKRHEIGGRKFFVCHHSCWGFETSASAIHDMLGSAVAHLSAEIDTFQVDSLPESYRQTFSAGGDWVEKISNLILRNPDPMEQFSRLSDLLEDIGGRIVFIVEDLDRNETRSFEIQEVLAFLERLKEHPNFSFILTGGLSSSQRIDYAKLCDHIEFLRTIQPQQTSRLIKRISQRCQDNSFFPHLRIGDPNRNYDWSPLTGSLMQDYEELSLPQAVASLLNTPRSLRHALGRTYSAWKTMCGEIDFTHLLAVNILRFGAPECFQFLMRRWDRIHSHPNSSPSVSKKSTNGVRQAINEDWNRTIQNVEWNPAAAIQIMKFILPATHYWLLDDSGYGNDQRGQQFVSEERYWRRAINEAFDEDEVRDQDIIRDTQDWLESPGMMADLVTKLTTQRRYADLWENFAGKFVAKQRDSILRLCEQVLMRILLEQGSTACHNSQGFVNTWRFARNYISHQEGNVEWLQKQISEAAAISIEMVNGLWHYYGNPGQNSILKPHEGDPVRRHVLNSLRANVTDGTALIARLSPEAPATLYHLVFDRGENDGRILSTVQDWTWLGPCILAAMRTRNPDVATNCYNLLSARVSGREPMAVDTEVLEQFFGDDGTEVIDILESMIELLPKEYESLVRNVVEAARQYFDGGVLPVTQESEPDSE